MPKVTTWASSVVSFFFYTRRTCFTGVDGARRAGAVRCWNSESVDGRAEMTCLIRIGPRTIWPSDHRSSMDDESCWFGLLLRSLINSLFPGGVGGCYQLFIDVVVPFLVPGFSCLLPSASPRTTNERSPSTNKQIPIWNHWAVIYWFKCEINCIFIQLSF